MPNTILLVEDDGDLRRYIAALLEGNGYEMVGAADADQLIHLKKKHTPAAILLDYKLPGIDGISALKKFRQANHTTPIIMLTANSDQQVAVQCMREGAQDFIPKPFDDDFLLLSLERTIRHFSNDLTNNIFELFRYTRHLDSCAKSGNGCSCGLTEKMQQITKQMHLPWEDC